MVDKIIREPAEKISALISEYLHSFDAFEQERILGIAQGMAIMRSLQDPQRNGGNQNES